MTASDDFREAVSQLFTRNSVERHPLFLRLEAGKLSPAQVQALALQIHHVVDHFPRFLAALIANIPDYRYRMPLVDNLYEEHGRMKPHWVHIETYAEFLHALGVSRNDMNASRPLVPVIAYNRAITDLCAHHPFPEGLGALGVIEEIVARASVIVGRFAEKHFGSARGSLAHFGDHERLDVGHANDIYEIAAPFFKGDTRPVVEQGLALGMYYHQRLYTDLLAEVA